MLRAVTLLSLIFSFCASASCEWAFLHNKIPRQYLSENRHSVMGEFTDLKEQTTDGFYYFDGISRTLDSGEEIGRILYKHYPEQNSLFISHLSVKVKKNKIGTILFAQALHKHPYVTKIRTNLGLDNFLLFKKAKELGKSDVEALKETAAYKIRKKLGFPYINKNGIDLDMEEESVIFEVSRFPY
ncbi:MAG: hypothetical protein KC478_11630 [Bacteriovoracaceae bacterium]|nr:hypothetical protein [Bacteriovoracaceae bacterium]